MGKNEKNQITLRGPKRTKPISEGGYLYANDKARKKYFRYLNRGLQIGLLIAYLIPITILTSYFNYKFNSSHYENARLNLAAVAKSQRNTISLYMQKRIVNIFNLKFYGNPSRRHAQQGRDD
jgi:two-component system, NtrC family, sensor kinase